MNRAIYQANPGNPLQFSPAAAIAFAKARQPTDGVASRDRQSMSDRTDEFKIHRARIKSFFHQKFHLA
jgi:hypothetical protein